MLSSFWIEFEIEAYSRDDRARNQNFKNKRLVQMDGLLQLQLATDSSAVVQLPYILQTLNAQTFSSGHFQKWTTRINSLIHSKDSAARWSGLSIALRTSALCKPIMIECAQSWVSVALPMLSVSAACRLSYRLIFRRKTRRYLVLKLP